MRNIPRLSVRVAPNVAPKPTGADDGRSVASYVCRECGSGAKVMAKNSTRKKQDQRRRRDRAEAKRHHDELFDRATDPALAPEALAALIMGELADSTGAGLIAYTRLQKGAEPVALAEAARLLVASCLVGGASTGGLPPGVLAFAAVAAHANGDEEEEALHTQALLDLARAASDGGPLQVAADVLMCTHPDAAAEMTRRNLVGHPIAAEIFAILAQPSVRAALAEAGVSGLDEFDVPGLDGLGDPSDPGFANRLSELLPQIWQVDPDVQLWYQARAPIAFEFRRRQGTPSLEQDASSEADK
jgi:hypothetical protein